jgi:hypothetical protein
MTKLLALVGRYSRGSRLSDGFAADFHFVIQATALANSARHLRTTLKTAAENPVVITVGDTIQG